MSTSHGSSVNLVLFPPEKLVRFVTEKREKNTSECVFLDDRAIAETFHESEPLRVRLVCKGQQRQRDNSPTLRQNYDPSQLTAILAFYDMSPFFIPQTQTYLKNTLA